MSTAPPEGVAARRGSGARRTPDAPLRLAPDAARRIRDEIARAGGREVCFLADVDEQGVVRAPRAVARGNFDAVLVAARDAEEGGLMLHNHPSGDLEPSAADLRVAAALYEEGLGTAIVDNLAERLYVVVEPPAPRRRMPLEVGAVLDVLRPGGPLARRLDGYEDRAGQRTMVEAVARAYNEGGIELVEAGTGTGKSLAYLLPAALWARANDERTVVSTNTINLQEQLVGKDLPLVEALIGEVRWALVKGRANYVSIRRAHLAARNHARLFEEDRSAELRALVEWIGTTEDGSLSDLGFVPSDDTWEEVRSDPDICLRARCPHFQECFYQRSRRRASSARVLVVNHHLLFTDLAVRRASNNYTQTAVLPAYGRIVLDEAHNVEDAATSHLGVELTRHGLYRMLSRLDRRGRGLLAAVDEALADATEGSELRERTEARVRPAVAQAQAALDGLIERLERLVREEGTVRLGPGGAGEPAESEEIRESLATTLVRFGALERELRLLRARLELDQELSERLEGRLLDLRAVERRLGGAAEGLRLVLAPGEDGAAYVRWLELRGTGRRRSLTLAAAPIELGDVLRSSLFEQVETAVLASATLSTRGGFGFVRDRLGIAKGTLVDDPGRVPEVRERAIASPFDFGRQTVLAVPTDLPDLEGADPGFDTATADVVAELAEITDGGLFVLFTAHAALRSVAARLRERDTEGRWPLLVQGEDARARLLARFVASGRAILLGNASFWEGVDVPGRPLRGLVIQKIPFRVPTEPVTAARMEAIERMGQDPFRSFMLPHAALRLKQGFGRLVRSRQDRGAVVVLDRRLVSRAYGRYLRDSLPPTTLVKGAWHDVRRRLEAFYHPEADRAAEPGASASDLSRRPAPLIDCRGPGGPSHDSNPSRS